MPMYYRGNRIANGVPAADGHEYSGQEFLSQVAYNELVELRDVDMTKVYVVVEVPVAEHVEDAAGATPTKAEFDALLTALKDAGLMERAT